MSSAPGNPPPAAPTVPASREERQRSLAETLRRAPRSGRIRVFAYGSLIWNPCFEAAKSRRATLEGYCRRFSVWSVHSRGTPENPGLGLALERCEGARCEGVLFTLPPGAGAAALEPLWEREMWASIYRPEWVEVGAGEEILAALTFVADPGHPQYAGILPAEAEAALIASASGKFGSCRDYLALTVGALKDAGLADPGLDALLGAVDRIGRRPVLSRAPGSVCHARSGR